MQCVGRESMHLSLSRTSRKKSKKEQKHNRCSREEWKESEFAKNQSQTFFQIQAAGRPYKARNQSVFGSS